MNCDLFSIVKGFPPCATYVGVSPTLCYLLEKKKPPCCLQLTTACEHCPYKNARQYNWSSRCIILASDFASNGIYNFLVPLRAHFHNAQSLRPIVLLLERKPSSQFIDAISWFPMVYWMPGLIDSLDDLIKAGINLADSVVVTNKESTNSAEEDYLADCNTIVAVQTMFKLFPSVGIITELSQSSNMRFMQFRAHDVYNFAMARARAGSSNAMTLGNNQNGNNNNSNDVQAAAALINSAACIGRAIDHDQSARMSSASQQAADHHQQQQQAAWAAAAKYNYATRKRHVRRHARDYNAHAYKFRLPFAAGNVFSASMLDTLLYQAFVKDYMITMVRLLLGIDQAPGSGFLSSMRITRDDLWIRTYGRLYQRLCSTSCEIPIGIYRNEPLEVVRRFEPSQTFGGFASQQASYEQATEELERQEITNLVRNRLQDLGMPATDYDDTSGHRNNTFSYVIINPNCDLQLKEGDLIRKLFMHRANSVRLDVANRGAANATGNSSQAAQTNNNIPQEQQQQQQQCYTSASLIKSCVSDGDIKSNVEAKHNNNNKNRQGVHISIKVDDDDDTTNTNDACCIRRSSCSDAPTVVPNINSMPPMSVASVVPNCSATNGQRSTIGSTNKSSCVLKTTQTSNNGTPIVVATTAPSTTATTTTINQQQSIVMMTTTTTTREHTAGNTFMSATRV
ncbi:Potassium channel subfamily T member 1, partial [Fragariocoptes setiger]